MRKMGGAFSTSNYNDTIKPSIRDSATWDGAYFSVLGDGTVTAIDGTVFSAEQLGTGTLVEGQTNMYSYSYGGGTIYGTKVPVPVKDASGNVVTDENGNTVTEYKLVLNLNTWSTDTINGVTLPAASAPATWNPTWGNVEHLYAMDYAATMAGFESEIRVQQDNLLHKDDIKGISSNIANNKLTVTLDRYADQSSISTEIDLSQFVNGQDTKLKPSTTGLGLTQNGLLTMVTEDTAGNVVQGSVDLKAWGDTHYAEKFVHIDGTINVVNTTDQVVNNYNTINEVKRNYVKNISKINNTDEYKVTQIVGGTPTEVTYKDKHITNFTQTGPTYTKDANGTVTDNGDIVSTITNNFDNGYTQTVNIGGYVGSKIFNEAQNATITIGGNTTTIGGAINNNYTTINDIKKQYVKNISIGGAKGDEITYIQNVVNQDGSITTETKTYTDKHITGMTQSLGGTNNENIDTVITTNMKDKDGKDVVYTGSVKVGNAGVTVIDKEGNKTYTTIEQAINNSYNNITNNTTNIENITKKYLQTIKQEGDKYTITQIIDGKPVPFEFTDKHIVDLDHSLTGDNNEYLTTTVTDNTGKSYSDSIKVGSAGIIINEGDVNKPQINTTIQGAITNNYNKIQELDDRAVKYDGDTGYDSVTLRGDTYNKTVNNDGTVTYNGGTHITNVAYADMTNGSEAVNVDLLKDQITNVKNEVTAADKHLEARKDYAVSSDGKVTLNIVDGTGAQIDTAVINDVASKQALDNLTDHVDNIVENSLGSTVITNQDGSTTITNNYSSHNYIADGDTFVQSISKLDQNIQKVEALAGKHTTVSAAKDEKNIVVKETNTNGQLHYDLSLNKDLDLGKDGSIKAGETTIDKDGITTNNINVGNTTINNEGVKVGDTIINENGLSFKGEDGKNAGPSVSKDGIDAGSKVITNVAPGVKPTDAVNVSQLSAVNQKVDMNTQNINMVNNRVNRLDSKINKVGAGAAALAALHPLDFDPDDKLTFSAGMGNYAGENAAAIGAFYRPDEKTMLSVGGTAGNGENMVNVGMSFSLDRVSHVTQSRTAMGREILDLREHVARQDQIIGQLAEMVSTLTGKPLASHEMFPDVPENHWAYAYVKDLAERGIIEGYPSGYFDGNRTMTRYEFAAMLDRALLKGVKLDTRLTDEFAEEMSRIRVDRIAGKDDDRHKIERVRVNNEDNKAKKKFYDVYGTPIQPKAEAAK
ncbi:YadA-like family protein [Phascolarctobacterium sp.]|uniref:YadA-like family protein n=1 Tax=Phascolarctobacterium sp. TaxID=2049039 RepID=UPI00386F9B65